MKKNTLITGTSSWIWYFLAEKFSKNENIFWISRTKNFPEWINFLECDLKNFSEMEKIFENFEKNSFDWIILNAWIWYFENFETMKYEEIFEIIQTNLLSKIFLVKYFLDKNLLKKWAKIIFIWSKASKKFSNNWTAYLASKFWIRWFAWWLEKDLWKKFWVHLINPKIVKTNFHKNSKIEIQWKFEETWLEKIFETCKKIFNWEEKNFEIDL